MSKRCQINTRLSSYTAEHMQEFLLSFCIFVELRAHSIISSSPWALALANFFLLIIFRYICSYFSFIGSYMYFISSDTVLSDHTHMHDMHHCDRSVWLTLKSLLRHIDFSPNVTMVSLHKKFYVNIENNVLKQTQY